MTTILHKRGTGQPSPDDLKVGEIAIDTLTGTLYTKQSDGSVVEIGSGSEGAGMIVSPDEPTDVPTGTQWLESSTGRVWIFDDGKWLEFPANVPAGEEYDDTELRGLISDEATAREEADNALGERIDNLDIPDVGSGLIEVSEEPPEPPYEIGQQWFSSTDGYLYVWFGAEWVATNMKSSSDGGGQTGDPYWSNVSLLINADDEPDGSQNIVDATNNNQVSVVNGAKISTSEFKHGTGSVEFDGNAEKPCLIIPNSTATSLANSKYTIEYWWKPDADTVLSGVKAHMGAWSSSSNCSWVIQSVDREIRMTIAPSGLSGDAFNIGGGELLPSIWNHIAVSFDGLALRLFQNGKLIASTATELTPFETGLDIYVGARQNGMNISQVSIGHLDDLRITKGVARYSDEFEPPQKLPTSQSLKKANVISVRFDEIQEDSNDADLP